MISKINKFVTNRIFMYIDYMNKQKIISSGFVIICASMINNIVKKMVDDIILPYSKGNFVKIDIKEYIVLIINIILVTFILFNIINYLE
jgi:hypothetical protein